jgi:hypothetical protein
MVKRSRSKYSINDLIGSLDIKLWNKIGISPRESLCNRQDQIIYVLQRIVMRQLEQI